MKFYTVFLFVLFFIHFFAQGQIRVSGKVTSDEKALLGANIIAKPLTKGAKFSYTTSNEKGNFELNLSSNTSYNITISFMGYVTVKRNVVLQETNLHKDFFLKEDPNELQEVIITYKEPIVVKKDTTTYRADAFTNGKERKLREVLKKLPGVVVDKNGEVTVKGKKVTHVMVENKQFFTGDSKLAINNIPADVIDEIQVIEDYHESDLLKGLETSDNVALNINLKEGKKKFAFGDIEVAGGVKDKYILHPTLFKYANKLSYGFIGDINNAGNKSFTLKDYIKYEGGFDINTFSTIYKQPIARLLNESDFNKNNHIFGGFNMQFSNNEKNNWDAFVIGLNDKTKTEINQFNRYLIDEIEERTKTFKAQNQKMVLAKIQLQSKPDENTRIKFENRVEFASANVSSNVKRSYDIDDLEYKTEDEVENFTFKSNFKIEKKFSKAHTSQGKVSLKFSKDNENQNWLSTENIFTSSLPIIEEEEINVFQISNKKTSEINTLLKHFWIINHKNHLYVSLKNNVYINKYTANLNQKSEESVQGFDSFTNDNENKELFSSLITEYKRIVGDAFVTFKLEYLDYTRFNKQFNITYNESYQIVLPNINIDWDITDYKKIGLSYKLSTDLPSSGSLNVNNKLAGFNSVYVGNPFLQNSYYHNMRFSFTKRETYGWNIYPSVTYKIKTNKIQNSYLTDGLYSANTPVNITSPEKELSINYRANYNHKYWRFSLRTYYSNRNYVSLYEAEETRSTSNGFTGSIDFVSHFLKGPNFDISLSQKYNDNQNVFFNSISDITKFDFAIDYEVENWIFKGESVYDYYKNRISETKNSFHQVNASVFYHKEDSLWSFELTGSNLGGNTNKITSSLSEVLFSETQNAVFPRTILGKIIFKL